MTSDRRPLDPESDDAVPAVLWASAALGLNIATVLTRGTWGVDELDDDTVDLWYSADALRAIAILSENDRTIALAERMIREREP